MRNRTNVFNSLCEILLSGKSKIKYFLGLMLCIFGVGFNVTAAPSDIDPAFGVTGSVFSNPTGTGLYYGRGMALQADGKIVMVGDKDPAGTGFAVARYNADGGLDASFTNGVYSFGGGGESALKVIVQADGKILIGGHATFPGANSQDIAVMRLNPNGSTDNSFGTNGVAIIGFSDPVNGNYSDYFGAIKIGSDGKIVVGGNLPNLKALLARLNTNGSFDTSFGTGGKVVDIGYGWNDLVILSDGSIVAAGSKTNTGNESMFVRKYTVSGSSVWEYTRLPSRTYGIAATANGKFIVVGQYDGNISVIRLNGDGTLDNSFNNDSISRPGANTAVAVQTDGKIVISASLFDTFFSGYNIIRLNTNGSPDETFGTNGVSTANYPMTSIFAPNIILQPDGKILVGGGAVTSGFPSQVLFTISRYKGNVPTITPIRTVFDYDGDGKSDISVFRPSENRWYILKSSDSSFIQPFFGASGDVPTPADYDGDNKTDIAIFRPSSGDWWYLSSINGAQIATHWGQSGDLPRPSDFDGDGKTDFVVYRPAEGKWYRLGNGGGSSIIAFGTSGDKPVIGDFDGDGKADPAIFRPSTGAWWYAASGSGGAHRAIQFGISTDIPVAADFDGDGKTDLAVYRPSEGGWHILNSNNGSYTAFPFGDANDKPVAADYDGDGKADAGVYRPSNGSWYLLRSTAGFSGVQWGTSSDIPTQNAFTYKSAYPSDNLTRFNPGRTKPSTKFIEKIKSIRNAA